MGITKEKNERDNQVGRELGGEEEGCLWLSLVNVCGRDIVVAAAHEGENQHL